MDTIKTFIFFDSETTGLPYQESNKTRITELCFTAVRSDHISLGVYPRIQNKLSLCLNPQKFINPNATVVSGLSNELLEFQPSFDNTCFGIIRDFLNIQQKPICFVAHNGFRFDYPILRAEIHKSGNLLPEDILCIDSLLAFKDLYTETFNEQVSPQEKVILEFEKKIPLELQDEYDEILLRITEEVEQPSIKLSPKEIQKINETTPKKQVISNGIPKYNYYSTTTVNKCQSFKRRLPFGVSFKLGDIYKRLTAKEANNAHKAEFDVDMLIECAAIYGQKFVDWANFNAKLFCDIPIMTPGKRIEF